MSKQYKGSLTLDWYNKQKAILTLAEEDTKLISDIPAPKINWVNKDDALFFMIDEKEGKGIEPFWVDRSDIRVKEARPLIFKKAFRAVMKDKKGSLPSLAVEYKIENIKEDDPLIENILIKGDNLLALNSLKKIFANKPEEEKVKCIYIDPPYNTGSAFDHYDDNLSISEWLTLFRDRVSILHTLLRKDGSILIQLDDECVNYAKSILDEIFGRNNFITTIVVKMSHTSGVKMSHADKKPPKIKEHILFYAKSKEDVTLNALYEKVAWSDALERYNQFIINKEDGFAKWIVKPLNQVIKEHGIDAKNLLLTEKFKIDNADKIFRTARFSNSNPEGLVGGKVERNKFYSIETKTGLKKLVYNNEEVLFASEKIINIDGIVSPANILGDIWFDIGINNLHNEGGIEFKNGKKPEKLIRRVIELASNENDLILDCFGGSGTTFAVAHMLNRKWIGVEIGNHCDTHIIKRLNEILQGNDEGVVSSQIHWKGGGSYKYFHLGASIIKTNKDGSGDLNWDLGVEFLQESFLSSYDYIIDNSVNFKEGELFKDTKNQPQVGVQTIGTKKRIAVITLNEPTGKFSTLSYEEMQSIYKTVKRKFSPEYINIFTNRGIEIAYDSKPDDLEVIKVPNAIFAELEK
jgi:adenine-specific DNA-methyltransferase